MRKLSKPKDSPVKVFQTCISRVSNTSLKARLTSVEPNVIAAASAFETAVSATMLHTMEPQDGVPGVVTKKELSDVYTLRMAKQDAPGRPIYDKLLAAPVYGRCPLCGQRTVSTLDHHLPKDQYPLLAVVPVNLVPACGDCNKVKTNAIPHTEGEQTLHPYFDDVEEDKWLYAKVVEGAPAALLFFVTAPACWDEIKFERVRYHFSVFKLSALYASHAAEELQSIRYYLTSLFGQGEAEVVKTHLLGVAKSYEVLHRNSWQTAMYKALAASDWYCAGGFDL